MERDTTSNCAPDEWLPAYREGGLDPASTATLETHLLHCAACRDALRLLGAVSEPIPKVRRTLPGVAWAAAAVVVALSLGLWTWKGRVDPAFSERPQTALTLPAALPAGTLLAETVPAARAALDIEVMVERGGGLEVLQDGRLRPVAGRSWIRSHGNGRELDLETAVARFQDAWILVERSAPRAVAWSLLREAAAAGDRATVALSLLEGRLEIGERRFAAPVRLTWSSEGMDAAPLSEHDLARLKGAWASQTALLPGKDLLPPGTRLAGGATRLEALPGDRPYRWILSLTGRRRTSEVGVVLGVPSAGGGLAWFEWVTGLAARPAGGSEVIELHWDGRRMTARVDGEIRFRATAPELARCLRSADPGWRVTTWDGEATVASCRFVDGDGPAPGSSH